MSSKSPATQPSGTAAPDAGARQRMEAFVQRYWMWNRVPVCDESTAMVAEMVETYGGDRISVPSGEECLTWVVPPKWTVNEAYLETAGGERIADFTWNPLYLKSYSAPYSGLVDRATLLEHVTTDPKRSDCIIYDCRAQYAFGERTEWGFSLPYDVVKELADGTYKVNIDVSFGEGTLDVFDWTLEGNRRDTIFFAAHTCHPAQINDGVGCIAVLLELFRWLSERKDRRYTYRLLASPEYFGAAAVLARGANIERLRYGYFLDMMGNGANMGFSATYRGDSYVDKVVRNVLANHTDDYFEMGYRLLWGNDEIFYDGPDFRIPTIGLGRNRFRYYHTDKDDFERCDFAQMEESLELLKKMVMVFENDRVLDRTYRGPLYLSRYGLYIDPKKDRKGYRSLQEIQILMDGTRGLLEIADSLGISYDFVDRFADELVANGLATIAPTSSIVCHP